MRIAPKPRSTSCIVQTVGRWPRPVALVYWLGLVCLTHWPKLDLGCGQTGIPGFSTDKLLHFGVFAMFTLLLVYAHPIGGYRFLPNLVAATVFALIYGIVDECTQPWFGRHFSLSDMVSNGIGAVFVFLTLFLGQTDRPASTVRLWCCRVLLAVAGPCIVWWVCSTSVPEAPAVHLLGVMGVTWLLAAARLAGRDRPGHNVLLCTIASTVFGVSIASAQVGFEWVRLPTDLGGYPGTSDDPWFGVLLNVGYVYQTGLLLGLWMWATWALIRFAMRADRAPVRWPVVVQPAPTTGIDRSGTDDVTSRRCFVGHALRVSLLTVVSRITGLLRDAVMAAVFGMGVITDAFFLGFLVPNLFRRLFGEGALSAAFIPIYSDLLRKDRLGARRLASLCIAVMFIMLGAIVLIGEALLASLAANVSADTAMAIRLTMIMLPYMPLICLVAVLGGMLQVHGRFGPPAAAPIVMNVMLIVAIFLATVGLDGDTAMRTCIDIVAVSVLVAGTLQLLWQVLAVLEVETFTARLAGAGTAMRQVVRAMLPMMIGLAVFQINVFLDSFMAWGLSPTGTPTLSLGISPNEGDAPMMQLFGAQIRYPIRAGSVAALQWSQRLYQFPLAVFGIAIATAIFPALVRSTPQTERADGRFSEILHQGLRLTMFIGLPASVGLLLVRVPLTRLIYEHGQFTAHDVQRVAKILAGYGCAVWAYSMAHVLTRAFYAARDARTPMKISVWMVGLNLLLNLTLIWHLNAAGLAWSTAICAIVQVVLLLRAVAVHVASPVDAGVWRSWGRSAWLTGVMAGALGLMAMLIRPADLDPITSAAALVIMVALGAAIYLGGAWVVGADELKWLAKAKRAS